MSGLNSKAKSVKLQRSSILSDKDWDRNHFILASIDSSSRLWEIFAFILVTYYISNDLSISNLAFQFLPPFNSFPFNSFLPLFTLELCFWDESLDWARGRRRDLRKHRLGISLSRRKPKGFRKERRRAYGPASSLERPAPCGFAKRGAVPAPLPGLRSARSPYVFVKVKGGEAIPSLDSLCEFPYTQITFSRFFRRRTYF